MPASAETPVPSSRINQLLVEARQGSNDALGELLEAFRPYLLQVANDELAADLQAKAGGSDLVQETFLEAKRDFSRFHGKEKAELVVWLREILRHNLANFKRHYRGTGKRQVGREISLTTATADDLPGDESPSGAAAAREEDQALQAACARLTEEQRQVIHWRNFERMSFADIGARLGRSAEAARKVWARAVEELQDLLESPDERTGQG